MKPVLYKIRLDVTKNGNQAYINVRQGDTLSREVAAYLYYGSLPYQIEAGTTAVFRAAKADGTAIFSDCTIDGNVIRHVLESQITTTACELTCEMTLYDANGATLYSPKFSIYVDEGVLSDGTIESGTEFSALQTAMSAANEYRTAWSNPTITAEAGEAPSASVQVNETNVAFDFTLPRGEKGDKGDTGAKGDKGEKGDKGATGATGVSGITFTPSVSASGVISWTNDGNLSNPAPVSIKGEKGETGEKGATGAQGETGAQGAKGDKGEKGDKGDKGEKGDKGDTGATGTGLDIKGTYASVTALTTSVTSPKQGDMYNVGTAAPYTIYMWNVSGGAGSWESQGQLQGAKGEKGDKGETGEKGDTGAQGVKGDKGDAFTYADFTPEQLEALTGPQGPKGDKGETGPAGPTGATGEQGPKGDTGDTGPQGVQGEKGATGAAGPNEISSATSSSLTGILKGASGSVTTAVAGTDYVAPVTGKGLSTEDYTTADKAKLAGLSAPTALAVTLPASGWSDGTQTVTAEGMTADTSVIVQAAPESRAAWLEADVYCSAQGAGTLTFTCETAPEADLTANVLLLEVAG